MADEPAPRRAKRRVAPHNLEAEESLLGSMLLSGDAVEIALAKGVRLESFYKPQYGEIFDAITAVARGPWAHVDVETTAEILRQRGRLDEIGGRQMLLQIQAYTPASAAATAYAEIVRDLASLRALIHAAGRIADLAYDDSNYESAADVATRAHELITDAEIPLGGHVNLNVADFIEQDYEYVWAIPGLLEVMDRLLLVAPEKFGKSTLIRQVAVTISQGLDPFQFHDIPPCNVMLVDLENPAPLIRRKLRPMFDRCVNTLEHPVEPDRLRICSRPEGINIAGSRTDEIWLLEQIAANVTYWKTCGFDDSPFVLCIGPIYKMLDDELDLRQVRLLQNALERIRVRFKCALILETHAPHESFSQKAPPKSLRPAGPRVWVRWPEFCRAIEPALLQGDEGVAEFYDVQGARDERAWPMRLRRGGKWPWTKDENF